MCGHYWGGQGPGGCRLPRGEVLAVQAGRANSEDCEKGLGSGFWTPTMISVHLHVHLGHFEYESV